MSTDVASLLERAGLPPDNLLTKRAALPAPLQELDRRTLLALGSTGRPPTPGEVGVWATELGLDPDDLDASLRELADSELVFLDPTARGITGAVPFAAGGTAHQVAIAGGPTVSANCALDALGIAAMLDRDIDVQSTDPLTGEQVTATSRDGGWTWHPADAVVFVGSTGKGRITETCCPAINFFTTAENARTYQGERGLGGVVLALSDAADAGILIFTDLLQKPPELSRPTSDGNDRPPPTERTA